MSNFTKRKAALYLVAIFIAGFACGSIVGFGSSRQQTVSPARQKEISDRTLKRLQSRLNLTPDATARATATVPASRRYGANASAVNMFQRPPVASMW